jgi:hypothetical protein
MGAGKETRARLRGTGYEPHEMSMCTRPSRLLKQGNAFTLAAESP